jgi:hypothetical protein
MGTPFSLYAILFRELSGTQIDEEPSLYAYEPSMQADIHLEIPILSVCFACTMKSLTQLFVTTECKSRDTDSKL